MATPSQGRGGPRRSRRCRQGPSAGADEAHPGPGPAAQAASGLGRSWLSVVHSVFPALESIRSVGAAPAAREVAAAGPPVRQAQLLCQGWGEPGARRARCAESPHVALEASWSRQQGGGCCRAQGVGAHEPPTPAGVSVLGPVSARLSTQNQGEGSGQAVSQAASPHTPAWAWPVVTWLRCQAVRCPGGQRPRAGQCLQIGDGERVE